MTEKTLAERARRQWLQDATQNGARGDPEARRQGVNRKHVSDLGTGVNTNHGSYSTDTVSPDVGTPGLGHLPGLALFATALLALELANAATSFWALDNLMGAAGVLGASFAVVLTVGLSALDTGGIVRLFGPGAGDLKGSGLLFTTASWLLCATTNAVLTWWAVSAAMSATGAGNGVLSQAQLLDVAPPFLALGLWLMRLLLVAGMSQRGGD